MYVLEAPDQLVPIAFEGRVGAYAEVDFDLLRTTLGVGFTGWVGLHGEPLLVHDANVDPRGATIPGTDDVDESMLVVPMRYDDVVVGVITLSKLGLNQFDRHDLRLLSILADQAATALESARNLARSERARRRAAAPPRRERRARRQPRPAPGRERPRPPSRDRHGRRRVRDLVVGSGQRSRRQPRLLPGRRAGQQLEPFFDIAAYPLTRRVLDDQIVDRVDVDDRRTPIPPRRRSSPAAGNRSLVMLPLVAKGESIGLVELISRGPIELDEERLEPRPDDRQRGLDRARERPPLRARPGPSRTATR